MDQVQTPAPAAGDEQETWRRAIDDWVKATEERLQDGDVKFDQLFLKLAENTAITKEIRDLMTAARVGFKVIGVLGMLAKYLSFFAAGWAALKALWPHDFPPSK